MVHVHCTTCTQLYFVGKSAGLYQKDHPDWVPTAAMLPTPTKENSSTSENPLSPNISRYIRRQERTTAKMKDSDAANSLLLLQ